MIHAVRIIFLFLVALVASTYLYKTIAAAEGNMLPYIIMSLGVVLAFGVLAFDALTNRKNLALLSGLFLGVIVGMIVAAGLGFLVDQALNVFVDKESITHNQTLIDGGKLLLMLISVYLSVSFVLQTKDDFRFIIPYVEFQRATKGPRPIAVDTSVIIDGRIVELATTGIFESRLLVPRFVLNELQTIADSQDKLKRARGRRGLDMLQKLQGMPNIELHIWDGTLKQGDAEGVDQKLVALAQQEHARLLTTDFNLNKIAQLRGVDVINLNAISDAVKPVVLPGENMRVRIIKPGEGMHQGIGYLEDGTMVVVESGRDRIGQELDVIITNALQTASGKMIFARVRTDGPVGNGNGPAR
jgi:uncharacterized protein YacL